jgi:hypothetical protein
MPLGNLSRRQEIFILDQENAHKIILRIADIVIEAIPAAPGFMLQLGSAHQIFQVNQADPHITLSYRYGLLPEIEGALLFDSGGLWKYFRKNNNNIISLAFPDFPDAPFRVAVLDASLSQGDIFIQSLDQNIVKPDIRYDKGLIVLDPFEYPLDEVVLVHYLAQGRGVLLHACGVMLEGQGLLFAGVSGAGKSTLAELWQKTDALLLSDDRIIVRPLSGGFTMYGTPWHGEARISSPEGAPLKKIFFLEQASQNYVHQLSPGDAAARLLVRCFPPFYDKQGMTFIVDFLGRLAEEVPCFELGFVPDFSVINFVRGLV